MQAYRHQCYICAIFLQMIYVAEKLIEEAHKKIEECKVDLNDAKCVRRNRQGVPIISMCAALNVFNQNRTEYRSTKNSTEVAIGLIVEHVTDSLVSIFCWANVACYRLI